MQFKLARVGIGGTGIPYGTWIILEHSEACALTSGMTVEAITQAIAQIGTVYAAIAAGAIRAQAAYIRKKNEKSGGKGVKLLFVWASGMIMDIKRRGFGTSPCS